MEPSEDGQEEARRWRAAIWLGEIGLRRWDRSLRRVSTRNSYRLLLHCRPPRYRLFGASRTGSHINKKTTYTDPRLAFAVEEKDNPDDIRQRFDSSSTALQVLHGRDLTGRVAIVTGGNCGIGYETVRALAFHGAHVFLVCRDLLKARDAIARIVAERVSGCPKPPKRGNVKLFRYAHRAKLLRQAHAKLEAMECDLASLRSVKAFAEAFEALDL